MLYGLHKIGFNCNKLKGNLEFIASFTTITAFENKLQQKQCDFTLNIYSYLTI